MRKWLARQFTFPIVLTLAIGATLAWPVYTHITIGLSSGRFELARVFLPAYILGVAVVLFLAQAAFRTPRRLRRRATGTLYALTHRRVLFITTTRRGLRIRSYEPSHPLRIERNDDTAEVGDVSINPPPPPADRTQSRSRGFYFLESIPNPREVDRLIRNTFEPAAGARRFPRT